MAKYYGAIGFGFSEETRPGIWEEVINERNYYGDVIRNTKYPVTTSDLNDNIKVGNKISILADPYAIQNFHLIKYVKYLGIPWKVASIEVEYPRLIATLGGEYNVRET